MNVFIGGEGPTDLAVVEALLRRVKLEGWTVGATQQWCKIRKYRAGGHATAEQRNVLGLALQAYEATAQVLAFTRDAADVHDRDQHYRDAIERACELFEDLAIVGGLALPTIEGWILSLHGKRETDALSKAAANRTIVESEIELKSTVAYVDVVESANLANLAPSLDSWLADARAAFATL